MSEFDYNKSISRELERNIEELITYSIKNLTVEQQEFIHKVSVKILELRQYFPEIELRDENE